MKNHLLCLLLLFNTLAVSAQVEKEIFIGLNGGITRSNISTNNPLNFNYNCKTGIATGLSVEFQMKPRFYAATDFGYFQNGYIVSHHNLIRTDSYSAIKSYLGFKNNITQHYVKNRWIAEYIIGDRFELILQTGFYWAYLMLSDDKWVSYIMVDETEAGYLAMKAGYSEYKENRKIKNSENTKLDVGVTGGIAFGYKLNSKYSLLLNGRYERSLLSLSSQIFSQENRFYNNSFVLNIGLKMKM